MKNRRFGYPIQTMIVGRGLIATAFSRIDREDTVFFASGVSNSLEIDPKQFLREENLVRKTISENPRKLFIYFSTCSIYDSSKNDSPYVHHKLNMEHLVEHEAESYLILRVSNAVGKGGNPHTLMNFLTDSIRAEKTIRTYIDASRNLIDVEDVVAITKELISDDCRNKTLNVAYTSNYAVVEIISIIEKYLDKKADLELVKAGQGYSISIPETQDYFRRKSLLDKERYLMGILKKYF